MRECSFSVILALLIPAGSTRVTNFIVNVDL